MNRNRFIALTDWALVPVFILSFYTGMELHLAGHTINPERWHQWAVYHTIVCLLFMIVGMIHAKSHWRWYKGLKTIGCKGKRRVVLCLSIVFLSVVVTGILLLLFVRGANSPIGLLHYRLGIAGGVLGVLHIIKRKQFLYRGFTIYILGKKRERE